MLVGNGCEGPPGVFREVDAVSGPQRPGTRLRVAGHLDAVTTARGPNDAGRLRDALHQRPVLACVAEGTGIDHDHKHAARPQGRGAGRRLARRPGHARHPFADRRQAAEQRRRQGQPVSLVAGRGPAHR